MQEDKVKDGILKYVVSHSGWGNTEKISKHLQIEHSTVLTLSKQIATDGLITIEPTASFKMENVHMLHLKPEGEHFYRTKSYRKISKKWYQSLDTWLKIAAILVALTIGIIKLRSK